MQERTTAIIGAGVIGLCTALELAKRSNPRRRIVVFEVFDEVFEATSAHNTGCIHFRYPAPQNALKPLGSYSFNLWDAISRDPETGPGFNATVGFVHGAVVSPVQGDGHADHGLPDWIRDDPSWEINGSPLGDPSAFINPVALGQWLYNQCKTHGVIFEFGQKVNAAQLDPDGQVFEIRSQDKLGRTFSTECDNLVIATGPWSSQVLDDLFPSHRTDLKPNPNASDWLLLRNPKNPDRPDVGAILLEDLTHHKLEFAARNDGIIWACNRRTWGVPVGSIGNAPKADPAIIAELKDYCTRYLNVDEGELAIVEEGRSMRPATESEMPIISAVPRSVLFGRSEEEEHNAPDSRSGVYVCTGHGSWGMSLSFGSAKLLAQIMHDEPTDINMTPFKISC